MRAVGILHGARGLGSSGRLCYSIPYIARDPEGQTMPTATDTLPDLTALQADINASLKQFDEAAERLFGNCVKFGEAIRRSRATIEETLRRGIEGKAFARLLAECKKSGFDALEVYA